MNTDTSPVIEVKSLSKKYHIYNKPSDLLLEIILGRQSHAERWALRDIDLTVDNGEVIGIIGRNGAGKSTLLKILAGTLDVTDGDVNVDGVLSTILELGTGFNPQRTGRENIYMGGMCLGLSKKQIEDKFSRIIDFSELGEFIDQPMQTYSTGMYSRLAFSVAIAVDPDVLIVDEALAVGDILFQRKCFNYFEKLKEEGKTILFVTHSPETVDAICTRAIYLKDGEIVADGIPKHVTGLYMKDMFGTGDEKENFKSQNNNDDEPVETVTNESNQIISKDASADVLDKALFRYGDKRVEIIDFGIETTDGERTAILELEGQYRVVVEAICNAGPIDDLNIGISVRTIKGVEIFAVNPIYQKKKIPELITGDKVKIELLFTNWFAPGDYFITFGAWGAFASSHYDRLVDALHIKVTGNCGLAAQSIVNLQADYNVLIGKDVD